MAWMTELREGDSQMPRSAARAAPLSGIHPRRACFGVFEVFAHEKSSGQKMVQEREWGVRG